MTDTVEQLALDLLYIPPASTLSDEPAEIDHGHGPYACVAFDGPERRYRDAAAHRSWVELEIDLPQLSWPWAICGTPLCINLKHLRWHAPNSIDYPRGVCVYCGLSANTRDHLLPRTWTGDAVRRNVIVVPACSECNNVINDRYVPAVNERRKVAHEHIRKRYARTLKIPAWTQADLDELGKSLRSTVERGLHDQRVVLARLSWPEDPTYDLRAMDRSGIENPYALGLLT